MMAFRSSVHSSTEHTPFELMFGREMRIPLDVMMGSGPMGSEDSYSEFVADLQGSLEAAYRDVRQKPQGCSASSERCIRQGSETYAVSTW